MIHIAGAGTTDITATQDGDTCYAAARPVGQKLTVEKPYYVDEDRDGFGSSQAKWLATEQTPQGYAVNNTDCDVTLVKEDSLLWFSPGLTYPLDSAFPYLIQ